MAWDTAWDHMSGLVLMGFMWDAVVSVLFFVCPVLSPASTPAPTAGGLRLRSCATLKNLDNPVYTLSAGRGVGPRHCVIFSSLGDDSVWSNF